MILQFFSSFNFLSNLHILHNGYTILPSHYKVQGLFFLHHLTNICYFAFLIIVILQDLISISLVFSSDIKLLFMPSPLLLVSSQHHCHFVFLN